MHVNIAVRVYPYRHELQAVALEEQVRQGEAHDEQAKVFEFK